MTIDFSKIEYLLNKRRRLVIESADLYPSAVMVPVYNKNNEPHVLLTKRTNHVESHKGEVSFPGGGRSEEDADLAETALRETEEEVGVSRVQVRLLGPLDDIATVTGFRITPYVAAIPFPYEYRINEFEIEKLIEVPLNPLVNGGVWKKYDRLYNGRIIKSFYYQLDDDIIWGATASIFRSFIDLLKADRIG